MKILVVGDLHGRKPRVHFKDFDCIVQVGDVCDDRKIGPLWKKFFKKIKKMRKEKGYSIGFMEFVESEIGKKKFEQYERESLQKGREILEYLNSFGKPVFFIPGNWDQSYGKTRIKDKDKNWYNHVKAFFDYWNAKNSNPDLLKGLDNVVDLQMKVKEFKGVNFIGYGLVSAPETVPKKDIKEKERDRLKKTLDKVTSKLNGLFKKRNKKNPTIFLSHNIPYGTKLDVIREKGSYAEGNHLGSKVARKMCQKFKPLLCIGCHIHEGKGKDKIGETNVVNTGFGSDAQMFLDLDEKRGKIRKAKFWDKG